MTSLTSFAVDKNAPPVVERTQIFGSRAHRRPTLRGFTLIIGERRSGGHQGIGARRERWRRGFARHCEERSDDPPSLAEASFGGFQSAEARSA